MASPETSVPSTDAIREELELILASAGFAKARQLRTFLAFLVEKTLARELDELKEYSIAIQVFGRAQSFDPTADNIVRVEARRLRARLAEYYASEGRFDPLLIDIPKGSYVSQFSTRNFQEEDRLADALSHYRIGERLGVLSGGVLYRGTDLKLSRKVLLWVTASVQDPASLKAILERARAAAALHHPNLCPIYEVGEVPDNRVFMVMASPGDLTLSECLRRGELSVASALEAAEHVAEALAAGHNSGFVHGALTPESVFLGTGDRSLRWPQALLVFLATDPSGAADNLRRSPEQRRGEKADVRSDIWAVGALLYEAVAGRPLNESADVEAAVDALPAETSPELRRIIRRCLQADPELRYQTATELANELKAVLLPLASTSATPAARETHKWVWQVAALAAVLVAAFVAWLWFSRQPKQDQPLRVIPVTHYQGNEASPSFSPDGSQVAFSWEGPQGNNVDIYVKLVGQGKPLRLTEDPQPDLCPSWSPDGKWLAFLRQTSGYQYSVMLIPALGGRERRLAQVRYTFFMANRKPAWSPDSKFLVLSSASPEEYSHSLIRISVETGETTPVLPDSSKDPLNLIMPAISPNGRRIAFTRTRIGSISRLQLLPVSPQMQSKGQTKQLTPPDISAVMPDWINDDELVFATGGAHSTLWRVGSGGKARQIVLPGGSLTEPTVSRSSHRLAFVSRAQDTNVWGLNLSAPGEASGPPAIILQSTQRQVNPQYSPDGKQIAFSSNREGNYEIWISRSDGSDASQLTSLGASISGSARWSPDGRLLAFDSNLSGNVDIYVVSVPDGIPHKLTDSRGTDCVPSWSPDGRTIYFGSDRDGSLQVWQMSAGGSHPQRITKNGGFAPLISPDGNWIFYIRGQGSASSLWRVPSSGGDETKIADSVYRFNFAVVENGVYYMTEPLPLNRSEIRFIDLAHGTTNVVATLTKPPELGFAISRDGRRLLFAQIDRSVSDIMLAENFR